MDKPQTIRNIHIKATEQYLSGYCLFLCFKFVPKRGQKQEIQELALLESLGSIGLVCSEGILPLTISCLYPDLPNLGWLKDMNQLCLLVS